MKQLADADATYFLLFKEILYGEKLNQLADADATSFFIIFKNKSTGYRSLL